MTARDRARLAWLLACTALQVAARAIATLALVGWPPPLSAQAPPDSARIAMLFGAAPSPTMTRDFVEPFSQGLREAGFLEGRNLVIDRRYAEGKPERLPALLAELLATRPNLILAAGPAPALAAQRATTLPIVAAAVDDPVVMGLVQTMARPGGNITGISSFGGELVARRLQLLKHFVPQGQRFAVLANPNYVPPANVRQLLGRLEPQVGPPLSLVLATGPQDYETAFADMKRQRVDGVVVLADATTWTHRARLQELMLANRMPSVWGGKDYLGEAGLASYQSDFPAIMRRAGSMAAQILKGADPAVVPFEQATKLELVVNLRAARRLGIEVPQAVRVAADEVID
jgi:putative ABC transport system substrate-binding protein